MYPGDTRIPVPTMLAITTYVAVDKPNPRRSSSFDIPDCPYGITVFVCGPTKPDTSLMAPRVTCITSFIGLSASVSLRNTGN
jgi:hypothetical protein